MPGQPFLYLRMLVGRIVVDDGVDRLLRRHLRLDGVEKADELLVPVAVHVASEGYAILRIGAIAALTTFFASTRAREAPSPSTIWLGRVNLFCTSSRARA